MKERSSVSIPAVGVICEFNPLHNGHVYLLREARRLVGEDGCVVCIMSGRSTQRGECAVMEPFARGRMALTGGADLVVELPFPWSSGSAEAFAKGGVHILASLGVKHLIFGSECGNIDLLSRGAELISSPDFTKCYANLCREGLGTAVAYTQAIRQLSPNIPGDFPASNDLLGLAYLAAIHRLGASMTAHTVKRMGQDYRDETLTDIAFPSATALRKLLAEAACDLYSLTAMLEGTMPQKALDILTEEIRNSRAPTDMAPLQAYYHTFFRLNQGMSDHNSIAEMRGGLYNHLHKCALTAKSPEDFMSAIDTKQYTHARLRRSMLFAVTGVTEDDLKALPIYTQLLAANGRGRAYLSIIRKTSDDLGVQVVTKPADAPESRQKELAERMDALFTLCLPQPRDAGWLMRKATHISE